MTRHMHSITRPICQLDSPIELIGSSTRVIFGAVDCADCLRRAIAEAEERASTLRKLLAKVEMP